MRQLRRFVLSFGPLAPVIAFCIFALTMLSVSRLLLVGWQWSRVTAVDGLWSVLGYGLRFDIIVCCWFVALPVVVSLLLPDQDGLQRWWRSLESAWLALLAGGLIYMEAATPSFINQYDTRPNRIFYEYLNSPVEVFSTLWADYKLQLFIGSALLILAIILVWTLCSRLRGQYRGWTWWQRLLVLPLAAVIVFLGARSSLDHRPANISKAAFSTDQMVNRLGVNSAYSLIYAISNISNEGRAERIYPKMDQAVMLQQIRAEIGLPESAFSSTEIPTLHRQIPLIQRDRPLNIVILLEESLGADFVGALGGEDLTPNLERLSSQGLWLTHLYATGTRSVRGIEATTTGFPPSPGRSVVKLGLAQQNFFTLAALLKRQGYKTSFIYGGESHFDNMRGFFLGNGFENIIDQESYQNPKFRGTWGVSDQDLFERADQELRAAGDQPVFALVFTSSNHPPFDIPAGVITPKTGKDAKLFDAVHYADLALGEFLDRAKTAPYAKNTLFLVVADHQDSVTGEGLVPIEGFHIPGLIIGPGVPVEYYDKIASQLDLPVTLLSLAGITTEHPMIGRDLLQVAAVDPGRAIMQFHLNHATMVGDQVVIHQPNLPPKSFTYAAGKLLPAADDPDFINRSSALALWPSSAYFKQQYRLSKEQWPAVPAVKRLN